MKLKVIKAIKGLVPGDILEYNNNYDRYEIYKVEEDISNDNHTKKTLNVLVDNYLLNDLKDYLQLVDEDLNPMEVERITYKDSPTYEEDCKCEAKETLQPCIKEPTKSREDKLEEDIQAWQSEVIKLSNKIIELEKQLEAVSPKQIVKEFPIHYPRVIDLPRLYFNW